MCTQLFSSGGASSRRIHRSSGERKSPDGTTSEAGMRGRVSRWLCVIFVFDAAISDIRIVKYLIDVSPIEGFGATKAVDV
jgi:hypothetical protein